MKWKLVSLAAALILLGMTAPLQAKPKISVFVSILPQKYFVEQIGGDLVEVSVMVQPGANPAVYEPKPQQMVALSKTKLYLAVGVPFEKVWLPKITSANPGILLVHTEMDIDKKPMKSHHNPDHSHESSEGHHHGIEDPHVWLAPHLVMLQARSIFDALVSVDPAHRSSYEAGYKDFIRQLVTLDLDIRHLLAHRKKGARFMVFHPAWGYFARAYGLEQIPIEIEGKEPKPAELQELIGRARKDGIKVIFAQPQFSSEDAETIAKAIGGRVAFADPLADDWASNLRHVAEQFKEALQ